MKEHTTYEVILETIESKSVITWLDPTTNLKKIQRTEEHINYTTGTQTATSRLWETKDTLMRQHYSKKRKKSVSGIDICYKGENTDEHTLVYS